MRISKIYVDEYFVKTFIKENWEEIISMISDSINDWGEFGEQIIDELKKYEINYITLIEKEDKEDDE